jgi:hypothetical protein
MTGSLQTEELPLAEEPSAPAPSARAQRFTIDGDEGLEWHLELTCARIVSGVRGLIPGRKLEAVLLGGGYGRGEGGVLRGSGGDRPYNDMEFYVAIRGNRHVNEALYGRRLEVLGEILTHLADAEVEFKVTSLAEMAAKAVSMFTYDLAAGHRLLWGKASVDAMPGWGRHVNPENIPHSEATRLLMNRCSGLLFARERLLRRPFAASDADFVRRNIAKAKLACGDAVLTAFGLYHWSCRERHRRLEELARSRSSAWFYSVLRRHAQGVEFKLHPESGPISRDELQKSHEDITAFAQKCWLWLEARRLGAGTTPPAATRRTRPTSARVRPASSTSSSTCAPTASGRGRRRSCGATRARGSSTCWPSFSGRRTRSSTRASEGASRRSSMRAAEASASGPTPTGRSGAASGRVSRTAVACAAGCV